MDQQIQGSWIAAMAYVTDLNEAVRDATLERDRAWVVMRQSAPARHHSSSHAADSPQDSRWGSVALTMLRHERASNVYWETVDDLIRVSWWYGAAAEAVLRGVLDGNSITVPGQLTDETLRRSTMQDHQRWPQGLGSSLKEWLLGNPGDPRTKELVAQFEVFDTDKPSSSETAELFIQWGHQMSKATQRLLDSLSHESHGFVWE